MVAANKAKHEWWSATLQTMVRAGVVIMLMLLSVDAVAQFQPWLAPGAKVDAGVRLGDLELHPGVAAEAGFDSNYFKRRATPSSSLSCQACGCA